MRGDLLEAIQNSSRWMDGFTRVDYYKVFREYVERFGPCYLETVREQADDAGLKALAEEMLNELEAGWKKQRIWNRSSAKFNDKQMLIRYLSPMLMGLEEPGCQQLAELLRDGWCSRWPKDAYQIATYQELRRGFRRVVLGIELKDDLRELEEEIEKKEK